MGRLAVVVRRLAAQGCLNLYWCARVPEPVLVRTVRRLVLMLAPVVLIH